MKAVTLLDQLDKIAYIQQEKMKRILPGVLPREKRKKYHELALGLIESMRKLYPGALTTLDSYKLTNTKNKASLILFLEGSYLNTAYSQLFRQTGELVDIAKQSPTYQRIQRFEKMAIEQAAPAA